MKIPFLNNDIDLEQEIEFLKTENEKKRQLISVFEKENINLKLKSNDLEAENHDLKVQLKSLNEKYQILEKTLKNTKKRKIKGITRKDVTIEQVVALKKQRYSNRDIAYTLKCSDGTVRNRLKAYRNQKSKKQDKGNLPLQRGGTGSAS